MSKTKKFLKFLLNPWLWILLWVMFVLTVVMFLTITPVKKLITHTLVLKQEIKTDSGKKIKQKINLNEGDYFSTSYSENTTDKEKIITTAGIICVLPNGNILHVIVTGENIDDKIKNTEGTIDFLTKHQNEIFDDIARTIVKAGKKPPLLEPKDETNAPIKKKV